MTLVIPPEPSPWRAAIRAIEMLRLAAPRSTGYLGVRARRGHAAAKVTGRRDRPPGATVTGMVGAGNTRDVERSREFGAQH